MLTCQSFQTTSYINRKTIQNRSTGSTGTWLMSIRHRIVANDKKLEEAELFEKNSSVSVKPSSGGRFTHVLRVREFAVHPKK